MAAKLRYQIFTILGGKFVHQILSRCFDQIFFNPNIASQLSEAEFIHERGLSKYYAWANLFRGALYYPVLYGLLGTGHEFSFIIISCLVAFHAICTLAELYKMSAIDLILQEIPKVVDSAAEDPIAQDPDPPQRHWYFTPVVLESENLYKALGFDVLKNLVTWYTDHTQLTKEERLAGKKSKHMEPTLKGMIDYERTTRQAEIMHLLAGSLNLPPFLSFLLLGKWQFASWVGLILLIDTLLVLLQRYHRTRVMGRLLRVLEHRGLQSEPQIS